MAPEQIHEIKRLYKEERLSIANIGKKFNCSEPAIRTVLVEAEVKIRGKSERDQAMSKVTQAQKIDFIKMYSEGSSLNAISIKHKVNRFTVKKYLERAGLTTRSARSQKKNEPEEYKELARLYQSGQTLQSLADK